MGACSSNNGKNNNGKDGSGGLQGSGSQLESPAQRSRPDLSKERSVGSSMTKLEVGTCRFSGSIGGEAARSNVGRMKKSAEQGTYLSLAIEGRPLKLHIVLGEEDASVSGDVPVVVRLEHVTGEAAPVEGKSTLDVVQLETLRIVEELSAELRPLEQGAAQALCVEGSVSWRVAT